MKAIHQLYHPSQPSINYEARDFVSYKEIAPDSLLRPYIYCYWQLATQEKLVDNFVYRVVSDGCIDILFETNRLDNSFITGFSSSYLSYELGQQFNYFGVRFLPAGFPQFFGIPASELTNQFLELHHFLPALSDLIAQNLTSGHDLNQISSFFNGYFLSELKKLQMDIGGDKRVLAAMSEILESRGSVAINQLDVGLSERQMRRLFQFYFGESPKVFSKVVRFQNILRAKPSTESLRKNKIFYDVGYYDQAHFIKEFKHLYGVTPSTAFGRKE